MSMQILDCTLRDGGYINDWRFGRKAITAILEKLERANLDIIECGFLTRMVYDEQCSLFPSVQAIEPLLPGEKRRAMYVAMIAIGEKELHPKELQPWNGRSIDGIRLTFHKREIPQAIQWAEIIQDKGYKVFMQPVGSGFYSDMELLSLVEQMNRLRPYAFYIVDTLGSMYRNDVSHRFYLIDQNMDPEIHLGFHGHNNLQLAFSNAQVLGKIQTKRSLLIDASVYGMGRGAGNLPTELIAQYINRNIASKYDVSMVMDIYDEYIRPIGRQLEWGYSMAYHIAASEVCHPNYASYLINKQTLTTKDMEKIIQSIPQESRILYDQQLIESLYSQFQSRKIDDRDAVEQLRELVMGKQLLLLAPGSSLNQYTREIEDFIRENNPYVIAVNFADQQLPLDACFFSNHKRLERSVQEGNSFAQVQLILTSNLSYHKPCLQMDYDSYTSSGERVFDNAGLMLLNLLQRCQVQEVYLAGFDGLPGKEFQEQREQITEQMKGMENTLKIHFLTPSPYQWR